VRPFLVFALICYCAVAHAQSTDNGKQVYASSQESVFLIYLNDPSGAPTALGSGFLISPRILITNAHVAEAGDPVLAVGRQREVGLGRQIPSAGPRPGRIPLPFRELQSLKNKSKIPHPTLQSISTPKRIITLCPTSARPIPTALHNPLRALTPLPPMPFVDGKGLTNSPPRYKGLTKQQTSILHQSCNRQ